MKTIKSSTLALGLFGPPYTPLPVLRIALLAAGITLAALTRANAQPTISTQPKDQFVDVGKNAFFSVVSPNAPPLNYQWVFNSLELLGETNRTLTLTNAQPAETGDYLAVVSNASGSVTSLVARLKVFVPAVHGFSSIATMSNRSVALGIGGETKAVFQQYYDLHPMEVSSNLVDWSPLATVVRTNAASTALTFFDSDAPQFNRRFYRTPTNLLITPVPQPTGPYPVGTFSRLLTDPSRTNTVRRTNHQFMITFWYPAGAQAGALPAPYVEKLLAQNSTLYESFVNRVPAFFSHSSSNAPLTTNQVKYPVLLYSPGANHHRRDNTDKTEELASWGYIVVGMDHRDIPLSVFPSGTLVSGSFDFSSVAAVRAELDDRVLDARFVLDELVRLNTNDPLFAGRLDLEKIGAFGWSFGGGVPPELCRVDGRCKAGVNMDGPFWKTNLLSQPLSAAFMMLRSAGPDPDPNYPGLGVDDRKAVFNKLATNAYWVKMTNIVHQSFGENDLIWDPATFQSEFAVAYQATSGVRASQISRAYLLSFFNKFLSGSDDNLLDGPSPDYPEVIQFLKK